MNIWVLLSFGLVFSFKSFNNTRPQKSLQSTVLPPDRPSQSTDCRWLSRRSIHMDARPRSAPSSAPAGQGLWCGKEQLAAGTSRPGWGGRGVTSTSTCCSFALVKALPEEKKFKASTLLYSTGCRGIKIMKQSPSNFTHKKPLYSTTSKQGCCRRGQTLNNTQKKFQHPLLWFTCF